LVGENGKSSKEKTVYGVKDFEIDVPEEILTSRKVIKDIEVMLEAEEFGKFKEKKAV
jgi:hypothetical protein